MSVIGIFSASFCHADEVAKLVAERLGYRLLAEDLLVWASGEFRVSREKLVRAMAGPPTLFNKFTREKEKCVAYLRASLAHLMQSDNVVCPGFPSQLLPKSITHVLKVCLVASTDYRVALAAKERGVSEREAHQILAKEDKERAQWTDYLFKLGPWDKGLYDVKIPMHEHGADEAAAMICEYARKDLLATTGRSRQAAGDFLLASRVSIALLEAGHEVEAEAQAGQVTLIIDKYVMRLEALEKELERIALQVPGVRGARARIGPNFNQPSLVYRKLDFEMPSRVLLVDDEKEFVQTLSERLEMRNLGSTVVYDGEQALSAVQQEEPEVMVLDLRMPGIDGLEVLRRVKAEHPDVEVIILTGHGTERDERAARELGAFAYLNKPVDIDRLAQTMREAYAKARARQGPPGQTAS